MFYVTLTYDYRSDVDKEKASKAKTSAKRLSFGSIDVEQKSLASPAEITPKRKLVGASSYFFTNLTHFYFDIAGNLLRKRFTWPTTKNLTLTCAFYHSFHRPCIESTFFDISIVRKYLARKDGLFLIIPSILFHSYQSLDLAPTRRPQGIHLPLPRRNKPMSAILGKVGVTLSHKSTSLPISFYHHYQGYLFYSSYPD